MLATHGHKIGKANRPFSILKDCVYDKSLVPVLAERLPLSLEGRYFPEAVILGTQDSGKAGFR
jgi:hypothetical protein